MREPRVVIVVPSQELAFSLLGRLNQFPGEKGVSVELERNYFSVDLVEFPTTAAFHLKLAEDPKNAEMLREALYEVTGRKLAVEFELGETGHARAEDESPTTEEDVLELMKSTFDARELEE